MGKYGCVEAVLMGKWLCLMGKWLCLMGKGCAGAVLTIDDADGLC